MATTVYKQVHEATETANCDKVTATIIVHILCMLMNTLKYP